MMHLWELDMILNGMLNLDYFHFLFHHHRSLGWEEADISHLTVVSGPTWPWPAPSSMRCSSAHSGTKRTGSASVERPEALDLDLHILVNVLFVNVLERSHNTL